TGHWRFSPTEEGLIVAARHTVTVKPSALEVLGPGTTVADARRYLRRVLSANSMKNLYLAKTYAEERAGG
ncbi:MAG: aromatase, partial [Actinobacteria bacterium]